jgi:hypothetical protein
MPPNKYVKRKPIATTATSESLSLEFGIPRKAVRAQIRRCTDDVRKSGVKRTYSGDELRKIREYLKAWCVLNGRAKP